MSRFLAIILLSFLLIGCTPEGKLRRLLKKYPQLIKVDTIQVIDTTIVQGTRKDSLISIQRFISSFDTTIIRQERLTVKMIYKNDSIYVYGECATDTLYRIRDKYIYKTIGPQSKPSIKDWLIIAVLVLIILFVIRQFTRK